MTHPREGQFTGCLIGECLGDALGFPVEGQPHPVCRRYVDEVLRAGKLPQGRGRYRFGQYSDDSQLARELMQSYADLGRFDPADYAARIAAIFEERRIVGPGRATAEAAARLSGGAGWEVAGTPGPSAGNGSAMRAGPIGLFFFDDPDQLVRAAVDQGRITHQDPRCGAGSVAIAGAVALAMTQGERLDPEQFTGRLAAWVEPLDDVLAAALRELPAWLARSPGEAVRWIAAAGLPPETEDPHYGISGFVTPSVLWSLYAFLRTPEDYWEAVCTAIAAGGDVDTTAAMTGAIGGAHLGLEGIPAEPARHLTDRGTWVYEALVALGKACYARRGGSDWGGGR